MDLRSNGYNTFNIKFVPNGSQTLSSLPLPFLPSIHNRSGARGDLAHRLKLFSRDHQLITIWCNVGTQCCRYMYISVVVFTINKHSLNPKFASHSSRPACWALNRRNIWICNYGISSRSVAPQNHSCDDFYFEGKFEGKTRKENSFGCGYW